MTGQIKKIKKSGKKVLKKTRKVLRKGDNFGRRLNDNFRDYLDSDMKNARKFRAVFKKKKFF